MSNVRRHKTSAMGTSLSYRTEQTPPEAITELIVKEAQALSRISNHWCEPYTFFGIQGQGLSGLTKVSLPGYSAPNGAYVQVDPLDDLFMMSQEVELLLRGLSGWARAYKLSWQIALEGTAVGSIDSAGVYSDSLRSFLAELHETARTPADPQLLKARVSQVRAKHAQRIQ